MACSTAVRVNGSGPYRFRNVRSIDAPRAAFGQRSRARPSCRSNTDNVPALSHRKRDETADERGTGTEL